MARQTGSPCVHSGLGSGLGFGSRCFCRSFDGLFQFLAEFGQVTRWKLAEQFDDLITVVVAGEREDVERGNVEAFGEPRNRLGGDGGEAVFHAGKVTFRQLAGVGEVGKGHVSLGAQFAKARADFGGIGIRFKSSGHEWRISSCFGEDNEFVTYAANLVSGHDVPVTSGKSRVRVRAQKGNFRGYGGGARALNSLFRRGLGLHAPSSTR